MSNRRRDLLNGWFSVPDQPISRVGVFDYHGSQLGPECPDRTKMYKVLRPAEELSSPEALDSFKLVPFINDHTMLGRRGKSAESVGVHGVTGQDIYFDADDGDGVMKGTLRVFSDGQAKRIDGGKKDLSLGYGCAYDWTPGVFVDKAGKSHAYDCVQRSPRGNHIALVKAGRMGSQVSVLDQLTFIMDAEDPEPMLKIAIEKAIAAREAAKAKGASAEIVAACDEAVKELEAAQAAFDAAAGGDDDMSEDAKAALAAANTAKDAAEAARKEAETKAADAQTALDAANATIAELKKPKGDNAALDAANAEIARLSGEVKTLKEAPAMDEASMFAAVGKRDALVVRLRPHIGVFDHSTMTLDAVAAYGVEKLGLKDVPKGQELTALDAALQTKPVSKPVTTGGTAGQDGADAGKATAAVDAYISA